FYNITLISELYALSLHDALPISYTRYSITWPSYLPASPHRLTTTIRVPCSQPADSRRRRPTFWTVSTTDSPLGADTRVREYQPVDRKSTRLNSSHVKISYAVFCF